MDFRGDFLSESSYRFPFVQTVVWCSQLVLYLGSFAQRHFCCLAGKAKTKYMPFVSPTHGIVNKGEVGYLLQPCPNLKWAHSAQPFRPAEAAAGCAQWLSCGLFIAIRMGSHIFWVYTKACGPDCWHYIQTRDLRLVLVRWYLVCPVHKIGTCIIKIGIYFQTLERIGVSLSREHTSFQICWIRWNTFILTQW